MDPIYTPDNLPQGKAPRITSFTASPAITHAGQPVILNWTANRASYFIVSPQVGAVRGNSVTVYPTVTTTYTLDATNQYNRSKKKVMVTIQ
jgi:hypothetical protein